MLAVLVACILAGVVLWSWLHGGLVAVLLSRSLDNADKVQHVRTAFAAFGPLAPAAYVAAVIIEVVVAPLPGLALYAPGGLIFGGFWGGFLSWVGNVAGALLAFGLARVLGRRMAERALRSSSLAEAERRLSSRGAWVIFLLRVNPLTSSDLVSYAAGLSSVSPSALVLGTAAGMAPLCWIQSYAAAGLVQAFPWLIEPLLLLAVAYVLAAVWWLHRLARA